MWELARTGNLAKMYVFGHLGLGYLAVKPFKKGLPALPLLAGTVLPDLIDKPLYYFAAWWTGAHGRDVGLISGTRTFGHTLLFLLTLTAIAYWQRRRSAIWAALAFGVATHLFFDNAIDVLTHRSSSDPSFMALLWPLRDGLFPAYPFRDVREQLRNGLLPAYAAAELAGLVVLALLARNRYIRNAHPRKTG